jgi:hypothetical protein
VSRVQSRESRAESPELRGQRPDVRTREHDCCSSFRAAGGGFSWPTGIGAADKAIYRAGLGSRQAALDALRSQDPPANVAVDEVLKDWDFAQQAQWRVEDAD